MNYYDQFNNHPQMFYPPSDDVTPEEKKKIRRNYNVIGAVLLTLYILMNVVCVVLYIVFSPNVEYNEDGMAVYGFKDMLIGGCVPSAMAIVVFFGYCLCSHYDPKELFNRNRLNKGQIFRYVLIVLGLQQVSQICSMILSTFLYNRGLEVSGLNYIIEHKPSVYAADLLGSVILAPIGEELIYRGVVLRCAAKVSQRFAIFFSAFIFGIMHGNPYQFTLGFLIGIPMAIITIKTGSLIPSIICHMANNTMASIPMVIGYFDEDIAGGVDIIVMLPVLFIAGLIALVLEITSGRMKLPEYTRFHKKRTFPIVITSWSMIVIMIFYVYDLVTSVGPIAETPEVPEIVGETVRLMLLK